VGAADGGGPPDTADWLTGLDAEEGLAVLFSLHLDWARDRDMLGLLAALGGQQDISDQLDRRDATLDQPVLRGRPRRQLLRTVVEAAGGELSRG
jgi:hypothetical protein